MRPVAKLRGVATAALVACAALAAVTPAAVHAQGRTLRIASFDGEYHVTPKGELLVTERITAEFTGSWNGLYRVIPIRYAMDNGSDYTLALQLGDATDENGTKLRTEVERDGALLKIKAWIPNAHDATHTLVLSYRVDNALRFFDEHDELYWNVTGSSWDYPIEAVSARVYLPRGAGNVRSTAFLGAAGSRETSATITEQDGSTLFRANRAVALREGLTIVHGWDPGVVERPTALARAGRFVRSNIVLLFPILTLAGMLLLWRRLGRDPALGSIVTRYEPPAGMTPAEAGVLIDNTVDNRDIAATLVDLAVRGHVRIHEDEKSSLLGFSRHEYRIERITDRTAWASLKPHERDMLEGIFASHPDLVELDDLKNSFYRTLATIRTSLSRTLTSDGHYRRHPVTVRMAFFALAVATGAVLTALGTALTISYGVSHELVILAAALSGLVIAVVGWFMPARTLRGTQTLRDVLGFEEFMSRVEGERMKRVIDRPELFEKYLPYAMALGVDSQWARAFDGICTTPPDWYRGSNSGMFRTHLFVNDLGRMTTSASTAFASAPRSSSGSGFSGGGGGGFSGGGFGGGGGGGF